MQVTFKGRPVEIESISHGRYDTADSFIEIAYYLDMHEDADCNLSEDELNALADECRDVIEEHFMDRCVSAADSMADQAADRAYDKWKSSRS